MKEIDWKILSVLYEKKSMTKAAEALYMTQSALTKRVRSMEDEWKIEIVHRTSQGVSFTEDGKYLVNKANIMLDFRKEIEDHFAEHARQKTLMKIGVPNSFARIHMPELLKEYIEEYNQLQISFVNNTSDVIINQITNGNIDIGILCGDFPYLGEKVCLFQEQMYMVTPIGVKMEDIEHMTLIESYFNSVVKLTVRQWWRQHFNIMPQETHKVPYSDIAIEMVENGLGVTFVFGDRWKVNTEKAQKLAVYDGNGDPVCRNVWMMIADTCFQSPEMTDFISFVERYYNVNAL